MPFEQRLDKQKPWVLIASFAMILTFFTLACLLIRYAPAPVTAIPLGLGPSHQAADRQVLSDPAEPEHTSADQASRVAAPYQSPDQDVIRVPGDSPPPGESANSAPSAREQRIFKTRRALETVDPRELLRQRAFPPK